MAADTVMGMSVDIRLANGQQMAYRVWVAGDEQRVLHSERLAVRRKGRRHGGDQPMVSLWP